MFRLFLPLKLKHFVLLQRNLISLILLYIATEKKTQT